MQRFHSRKQFRGNSPRRAMPAGRQRFSKTFHPGDVIRNATSTTEPQEEFKPAHTFRDFSLQESLYNNIIAKGYTSLTPIQDQAIPAILNGQDVIGIANTGTGKTAAFLIPLVQKVITNSNEKILIVAPTRELASQIRDELYSFTKNLNIYSVLAIGGLKIFRQKKDLQKRFNFVIGTPGRIQDLIQERALNLSGFHTIVLDETDHMVDIGFIHDIKRIIALLPTSRHSLFFSATVDGKVREILNNFVTNPITISVKTQETAANVSQTIVKVPNRHKKIEQLHDLLIQKEYEKVLIFGRTKWGVQKLSDELVKRGFRAEAIHGNKKQNQRLKILEKFKRNQIQILLATDVASRGLDIDNVSHVINYELPVSYEDYIHRIGRTGRASKKGVALTFVEN